MYCVSEYQKVLVNIIFNFEKKKFKGANDVRQTHSTGQDIMGI